MCHSYMDFFMNSAMAAIKGLAVELGLLPPSLCENELVGTAAAPKKVRVANNLLVEAKHARGCIKDFADELDDLSPLP